MIDRERFDNIKERHGTYASWAVWADCGARPKSNVGELSVLDPDSNPSLLDVLLPDIVMVGLNFSRSLSVVPPPFQNFHSPNANANDFKIRYAFKDTPYYGAYMTDIIKNFPMRKASDLRKRLNASLIQKNAHAFISELSDLGADKPTIIAFGKDAHELIKQHVSANAYARLFRVTHYSHQMGKERYRDVVDRELHGDTQQGVPGDGIASRGPRLNRRH